MNQSGSNIAQENNTFQGRISDRMVVGLLDSKAFKRDRAYYPFQKFGLETVKEIIKEKNTPVKPWHWMEPILPGIRLDTSDFSKPAVLWKESTLHAPVLRLEGRQKLHSVHVRQCGQRRCWLRQIESQTEQRLVASNKVQCSTQQGHYDLDLCRVWKRPGDCRFGPVLYNIYKRS